MAKGDVVLTPFSQAVIQSYSDYYCKIYMKDPEVLFLSVSDDKEYSYMYVWGDQIRANGEYPFSLDRFLGTTYIDEKPVFVSGPKHSIFYRAHKRQVSPIKGTPCEYDPFEWKIVIGKNDTTYCFMKSSSNSPSVDNEIIDSIALKYFRPTSMTGEEKYTNSDLSPFGVAHPTLSYEEREQLIKTKYCFDEPMPQNKSIIINLLVDKNGYASFYNVEEKSGIKHFDKEALRMSKEICGYPFTPAQIRNQNVNSIYSLYFCDKGLLGM